MHKPVAHRILTASIILLAAPLASSAATVSWYGNGSTAGGGGAWDLSSLDWFDGTNFNLWNNANNDIASFGGTTAGTVTLGANLNIGGLTFTTAGYTIAQGAGTTLTLGSPATFTMTASGTVNAIIAGSNSLTKTGSGVLTLGGINTYSGGTTISAGPTVAGSGSAGTAAIVMKNGSALGTGDITIGAVSNLRALEFNFVGTMANNLILPTATATQVGIQGNSSSTRANLTGVISGGYSSLVFFVDFGNGSSTGVIRFANTANTFTASKIDVNRGVLAITADGSLGAAGNTLYLDQTSSNGGLRFDAPSINVAHPVTINTTSTFNLSGDNNGDGTVDTLNNATISGVISGAGALTINAGSMASASTPGTLTLTGNNTFTSAYTVAANTNLVAASSTALGAATGTATVANGATIAFSNMGVYGNNKPMTINGAGTLSAGVGVGALENLSGNNTFNGPITMASNSMIGVASGSLTLGGVISGNFALSTAGTGALTLTGTNTYSGATNVNSGTLNVNGSLAAGSTVTVAGGAALGGTGTINGATILNSGGILNGASTGRLTLAGGLTVGATAADSATINIATSAMPGISVPGALTLNGGNGSVTLNLTGFAPAVGQYTLISYGSLAGTGYSAFTLGTLPPRVTAILVNDTTANSVDVNVTGVDFPIWTGNLSSEWSTNTLSSPKNWVLNSNNAATTDYLEGDAVVFNDTASSTIVDISTANVSPKSATFDNSVQNYTITGTAGIIGSASLTKTGTGTLTISNQNGFTGAVNFNGGVISVSSLANGGTASALGAGTAFNFDGGTLAYTGSSVSTNRTITLNSGGGTIQTGGAITLSGTISGTGALTKTGSSSLTVSGTSNTYSGGTNLAAGPAFSANGTNALAITNGSALGTGPLNITSTSGLNIGVTTSSAVTLSNNIVLPTPTSAQSYGFNKNSSGQLTFAGVISGGNANTTLFLSTTSSGDNTTNFYFSNDNTFVGKVQLNRGTITVAANDSLGAATNQLVMDGNGNSTAGDLQFANSMTFTHSISTITSGYTNPIGTNGNNVTFTGNISGSGGLTKIGNGTLTLSGTQSYTGATSVKGGTLEIDSALSTSSGVTVNTGGTLNVVGTVSGHPTTVSGGTVTVSATGTLSNSALTVNSGNVVISGNLSGSTTTVSGGTFEVDAGSTVTNSPITVGGTGTLTGGGIVGTATLNSGGTFAPGLNGPGFMSVGGNLNLNSGSHLALDLNGTIGASQYDQVLVANTGTTVTLGGDLQLSLGYTPAVNDVFYIIINQSGSAINGTFSNAIDQGNGTGLLTIGNDTFLVSYSASFATGGLAGFTPNQGQDVALELISVPEPNTTAALVAGLSFLLGLQRFRRRMAR